MSAITRLRHHLFVGLAALVGLQVAASAAERRPVPAVIIYPGAIIREQMLISAEAPDGPPSSVFVTNPSMLIGKAARRTLLPGQPIPNTAIGEPRLVTIGARVRLVFEEGGLLIATYATALQAGAAGDVVSVRNMESGITLSGVIFQDGSVHVGPG